VTPWPLSEEQLAEPIDAVRNVLDEPVLLEMFDVATVESRLEDLERLQAAAFGPAEADKW
jgi:hypothetical protein